MASSDNMKVEENLESSHSVKYMRTMLEDHEALEMSFQTAYPSLLRDHPDRWVAWGKNGIVGVSDSQDDLLRKMRARNLLAKDVVVEFLDSDPQALIL